MTDKIRNLIMKEIADSIDIPDTAYERAEARYKDLGQWFGQKDINCYIYNPHIYPQGSFRLGTVVRPIADDGEYDLDVGCRLRAGITKDIWTQQQVKSLVGRDVEEYRVARNIQKKRQEKHRCWRLNYADKLNFHLDIVPSIPETAERRQSIQAAIYEHTKAADLAVNVAKLAGAITDNRKWNYQKIHFDWPVSNSEGFALWFEYRMNQQKTLLEAIRARAAAKVDPLPAFRWKSPLQRCVQLLKRHRDIYFARDPDGKPASIIITTLSARAYQGEEDIPEAIDRILSSMASYVYTTSPRVPNPVDPAEDFSDRWKDPANPGLEEKFWLWLKQAQKDFNVLGKERNPELITEAAKKHLGSYLNSKDLRNKLGTPTSSLLTTAAIPGSLSFPDKPIVPQKPAKFA